MSRYTRAEVYFPVDQYARLKDVATMLGLSVTEYCRNAITSQVESDVKVNQNYLDKLDDLRRHRVVREG